MKIYENLNKNNKNNVDIKISAHDALLEQPPSGALKASDYTATLYEPM